MTRSNLPVSRRNHPTDVCLPLHGGEKSISASGTIVTSAPSCHAFGSMDTRLPHNDQAPRLAREHTRLALGANTDPALLDDTLLVITEMVTNSVQHALPPITLRVQYALGHRGIIHVEVADAGPGPRAVQLHEATSPKERGRGTDIIKALSSRTGAYSHHRSAVRWATLSTSI